MSDPVDPLLSQLKGIVIQRVADDDVPLPSLPQVLMNSLKELRKPDFDLTKVTQILEADPLVTARLLRLANSAKYMSRQPILTIGAAVGRVGGESLRVFLTELAAERVFASKNGEINKACRGLWQHSVAVGIVARELAAKVFRLGHGDVAEAAYMAGLLHDIGKPILAAVLLDAEKRLLGGRAEKWLTTESWLAMLDSAHRSVGLLVAAKWDMPLLVRVGISNINEYDRSEPYAVSNFVRLANALTKRAAIYVGPFDKQAVDGLIAQGQSLLGFTDQVFAEVCEDLMSRVADRLV
ncbi:MAG: HDOD domain-containing protein [Deltaproteobacteria bacterium]|nr:HDOD domain-containing protein [Deltaproteobacteria bacterium]